MLMITNEVRDIRVGSDANLESVASTLRSLAHRFRNKYQFQASEALLEQAILILERGHPSSSILADSRIELADTFNQQGLYFKADEIAGEVVRQLSGTPEQSTLTAARAKRTLGYSRHRLGQYRSALALFRDALLMGEQAKADGLFLADCLIWIAYIEVRQGDIAEARNAVSKSREVAASSFGESHAQFAAILYAEGYIAQQTGDWAQASHLLRNSHELWVRALGPEHPNVAWPIQAQGYIELSSGNYDRAEKLLTEAYQIREKTLGPEHDFTANPINGLGYVHLAKGRHIAADLFFRHALRVRSARLGDNHPDLAWSLDGIGAVCFLNGRIVEAENHFERALSIRRSAAGGLQGDAAWSLQGIADVKKHRGLLQEAESAILEAITLRGRIYGSDHLEQCCLLSTAGDIQRERGEVDSATSYYEKVRSIVRNSGLTYHPSESLATVGLANVAMGGQRFDVASELYVTTLSTEAKVVDEGSAPSIASLIGAGFASSALGRHSDAYDHLSKVLPLLPRGHPSLPLALEGLVRVARDTNRHEEAERLSHVIANLSAIA
jgi:hypothetical protein